MTRLHGVIPPVCTPLTPEWLVDKESLAALVTHLLDAGVHGLFVLGSTSEVAYLPDEHRREVLDLVVAQVAGRVPVLAGAIDMSPLRVLEHARAAREAGADAIVATAPFYARTDEHEIERHFRTIAERAGLPVYAYDLPVSVHSKLSAGLVTRLAADGVLAGLKDSSGEDGALRGLLLELRARELTEFAVFTGSELTADYALGIGAAGLVPGLGNVDPHGYVRLYEHAVAGRYAEAAREQERLVRLFDIVNAGAAERMGRGSSALGAFKAALELRGILAHPTTAPPQIPLNETERAFVRAHLQRAGLLDR
ncbi:dihydrodipicolinate synthase family protein [Sciscionella sediminilitoris]|uniref:dihydrodipicolinate synthase family protein n=1 Tax=Sciscionella sediminilitoris TaxID=1445613 RepID=UPI0004DEE09E|nr:dihydrodipicolinate synthase family protein [Sciscionella sp. SE31]